jgi:hypothetical protein
MLALGFSGIALLVKRTYVLAFIVYVAEITYCYVYVVVFWMLFPNSGFSAITGVANLAVGRNVVWGLPLSGACVTGLLIYRDLRAKQHSLSPRIHIA